MNGPTDRRQFIKQLSLSVGALAASPLVARAKRRGGLTLSSQPKHVVIVGGGLAGLAAAYELKRAGHQVTILEARKTAGGRVRTLRDFSDGLYAEAGAHFFPQDHEFTWGYATDFGLELRPFYKFGLEQVAHIQGVRFRIGPGSVVPFDVTPNERQAGVLGLPTLYLGEFMRQVPDPRQQGWPPESLRWLDDISMKELLELSGASEPAVDIIEASHLGVLGFGIDSFSALDGVVIEQLAGRAPFYEIVGGCDQLVSALKKRVKKQFKKKAVVRRIEQDETSVRVTYTRSGQTFTISADRCICTLPFPVLKEIEVSPPFSEPKRRAILELKLTPVTRTFMEFRSRVWEQDRLDGYALTDLPIQSTYSPTLTQEGQRGILASYAGGQRALDLGAMSEEDRQSSVLRHAGKVFGDLAGQYSGGASYIWHEDPWARGGFTYFEPGQITTLLPEAQRPEGRIHFAGEHTSAWHGWMNGALESGNRAADEVNQEEAAEAVALRIRSKHQAGPTT
jgi:monoamine oxidase